MEKLPWEYYLSDYPASTAHEDFLGLSWDFSVLAGNRVGGNRGVLPGWQGLILVGRVWNLVAGLSANGSTVVWNPVRQSVTDGLDDTTARNLAISGCGKSVTVQGLEQSCHGG